MRSHYGDKPANLKDREKIYRAGNGLANWLGLDGWIDIPLMQTPERLPEFRKMIEEAP